MKVRTGFVSNSSSSSFILRTSTDLKIAIQHGLHIYKVSDIIKRLKPIHDGIKKLYEEYTRLNDNPNIPNFICEQVCYINVSYYQQLQELLEKDPEVYITSAYDRDEAYRKDFPFEVFESDL